jgi:hypothetical protein
VISTTQLLLSCVVGSQHRAVLRGQRCCKFTVLTRYVWRERLEPKLSLYTITETVRKTIMRCTAQVIRLGCGADRL